jgi:hypothetical protein
MDRSPIIQPYPRHMSQRWTLHRIE